MATKTKAEQKVIDIEEGVKTLLSKIDHINGIVSNHTQHADTLRKQINNDRAALTELQREDDVLLGLATLEKSTQQNDERRMKIAQKVEALKAGIEGLMSGYDDLMNKNRGIESIKKLKKESLSQLEKEYPVAIKELNVEKAGKELENFRLCLR